MSDREAAFARHYDLMLERSRIELKLRLQEIDAQRAAIPDPNASDEAFATWRQAA